LDTIGKLVPSDMFSKTMLSCKEDERLVNPRPCQGDDENWGSKCWAGADIQ